MASIIRQMSWAVTVISLASCKLEQTAQRRAVTKRNRLGFVFLDYIKRFTYAFPRNYLHLQRIP